MPRGGKPQGNQGMVPANCERNRDRKLEQALLYPHAYPHMNLPAIADDLVYVESMYRTVPNYCSDFEADRYLAADHLQ